ncbi:hypothetical protein Tco_1262318 [Tanacetum coccineum]
MTMTSNKELVTPYEEPERVLHSTRKHFKTMSLDNSSSPEFDLFFDHEDQPKIDEKARFELKGQFLKELHDNNFSGSDNEDENEHIEKNALWIYWTRGDDEKVITDDELSNPREGNLIEEIEIAKIFRIETDIFQFETSLCEVFREFNYLLKIDVDVANMPWLDYRPWMEPSDDIEHIFKSFRFKNEHVKWPTCNWKTEKYCNGGDLPKVIWNRYMIYFKNYEWYENLKEGELKDEDLNSKAIFEGSKGVDKESSNKGTNNDYKTQNDKGRFDEHELIEDDDDDIGDLEDYLLQKKTILL